MQRHSPPMAQSCPSDGPPKKPVKFLIALRGQSDLLEGFPAFSAEIQTTIHRKMSDHSLSVKTREGIGRGSARRLRAQGLIPAVIYGKNGNRNLAVAERDFQVLMRELGGSASVITLQGDSNRTEALIHDFQRDPLTDKFKHIDFLEVVTGEPIAATIPIHLTGEAKGIKSGGLLEQTVHEIPVHCLPKDLPEHINVDISNLDIGDSIHLGQVSRPTGVAFDGEEEKTIIRMAQPQKVETASPEPGDAEESVEVPTNAEVKAKKAEADREEK